MFRTKWILNFISISRKSMTASQLLMLLLLLLLLLFSKTILHSRQERSIRQTVVALCQLPKEAASICAFFSQGNQRMSGCATRRGQGGAPGGHEREFRWAKPPEFTFAMRRPKSECFRSRDDEKKQNGCLEDAAGMPGFYGACYENQLY